jgi:hypothetical protein
MTFQKRRRQQFLSESFFALQLKDCDDGIANIEEIALKAEKDGDLSYAADRRSFQAFLRLGRLSLRYTAGEPIDSLHVELEEVIAGYERYGALMWNLRKDRNEPVFEFTSVDEFCQLMQLTGLCFLLHRRDLLPRLAVMQDGLSAIGRQGEGNGGADWLFEEFMAHGIGADKRYESNQLCCSEPYEALADAMNSTENAVALRDLDRFLRRWYKDLAGTGWHDSHKPDENGNQGGYYGYWSFEAGAAVLLLGIEDDSSLHKYLYYPKDLVVWARQHASLSDRPDSNGAGPLSCQAGNPCPREGFWFTPAKPDSRRRFNQGEIMPSVGGDYGVTIWQRDERQG